MFIIDRFEGEWAVIESNNGFTFNLPISTLPEGTKEGDVVVINVQINQEATKKRRDKAKSLLDNFFDE